MIKRELFTIGLALIVAFIAGSVLIWAIGESPLEVYQVMLARTWGTKYGIGQVFFKATPLILTGLAVATAFKVGLFNIGAEGQVIGGCFATGVCGAYLPAGMPGPIAVVLCILAGMATGGLIGGLAGYLKARFNAHEVINTIMLNRIMPAVVLWLGNTWFFVSPTTHTKEIIENAHLSPLGLESSAVNTSLIAALFLALAVHLFMTRTRRGFEWRAVGQNLRAAECAGVKVPAVIFGAMALSGAIAGAAGAHFVLGYKHYFEADVSSGVGFIGIAVALLGRNHPVGIVLAALLFGTLSHGGLEVSAHVPRQLVDVLQAVMIIAVAVATAYGVRKRARARTTDAPAPAPTASGRPTDG